MLEPPSSAPFNLQMEKLRPRQLGWLTQGHTVHWGQVKDGITGLPFWSSFHGRNSQHLAKKKNPNMSDNQIIITQDFLLHRVSSAAFKCGLLYCKGNWLIPAQVAPLAGVGCSMRSHRLCTAQLKKRKKTTCSHGHPSTCQANMPSSSFSLKVFSSHCFTTPSLMSLEHTRFSFLWDPKIPIFCTHYPLQAVHPWARQWFWVSAFFYVKTGEILWGWKKPTYMEKLYEVPSALCVMLLMVIPAN